MVDDIFGGFFEVLRKFYVFGLINFLVYGNAGRMVCFFVLFQEVFGK